MSDPIYTCPVYPERSPDAAPSPQLQITGSTILQDKYNYETTTGKPYKFKSQQDLLLYKLGRMREINMISGQFPNARQQVAVPSEYICGST